MHLNPVALAVNAIVLVVVWPATVAWSVVTHIAEKVRRG